MDGPFDPNITPVISKVHFISRTGKWRVTMSRQVVNGAGVKREISRQTFDTYPAALTAISVFWGNA